MIRGNGSSRCAQLADFLGFALLINAYDVRIDGDAVQIRPRT